MVDGAGAEADGLWDHAQGVELVGVDSDGVAQGLGTLEEADGVLEGPGALLAEGVDGDAGKLAADGGEGFVDGAVDEVGDIGVEGVAEEGGGDWLGIWDLGFGIGGG